MAIDLVRDFRFTQRPFAAIDEAMVNTARSRLAQAFADRLYLSDGGAFLITGYRGVGKTTFVNDVLRRLRAHLQETVSETRNGTPMLLDVCLNVARPITGVELMHLILRQLHNRLEDLDLLQRLPKALHNQLRLAFLRTSAILAMKSSEEQEAGMSLEKWLSFSSKVTVGSSRDINYLAYDERSAESDLIALAQQLAEGFKPAGLRSLFGGPIRLKLLFVFDELDKIEEAKGNETALTDILHSLKTLFTTSGISFIFVAGRSLHERWLQDVQSGDSVFESVFTESRYLPAVWDQVDEICDPLLATPNQLSDYDGQLYGDFKRYLAYTGRGIPRRILRGFYERVCWDGKQATLALSDQDRRQIRFHADLYQLLAQSEAGILGESARELRPQWLDKQRLGLYYILDWILARGASAFTLVEVIDAASHELKAGIAPARELAPRVVTGLIDVLCKNDYIEKFTDIEETLNQPVTIGPREKYRLVMRRLIEMGCYREPEARVVSAEEPKVLGQRYQLMDLLGQGASAQVYRALDRVTDRIVALKHYNREFFSADSTLQERLRGETAVHHRLRHSGIAEMYDVAFDAGTAYIVMEYLDGVTLNRLLKNQGSLPLAEALTIMRSLLETLAYLHEHGIIWRDVKPSNIMITVQGRVVIVDFGTAQTVQNAQLGPDTTRVGFAAGTPAYMSPEQARGGALSPASDLYSLGIILFEMLTGEKPWPANSPLDLLRRLQADAVDRLPDLDRLPAPLHSCLRKAFEIDTAARFQSAQEMLETLPDAGPGSELASRVISAKQTGEGAELAEKHLTQVMRVPQLEPLPPEPFIAEMATPEQVSPPQPARTVASVGPVSDASPQPAREIDPDQMTFPRSYPLLTVTAPGVATRHFGLFGNRVTLGRAHDCDIRLGDSNASRYHACIVHDQGSYRIEDMNSSNGLMVNGKRVYQAQDLQHQDRITIGQTQLLFKVSETLAAEKETAA